MKILFDFFRLIIYILTAAVSLASSIIVKNKASKIIWLSVSILWTITFLINLAIMMGLL